MVFRIQEVPRSSFVYAIPLNKILHFLVWENSVMEHRKEADHQLSAGFYGVQSRSMWFASAEGGLQHQPG